MRWSRHVALCLMAEVGILKSLWKNGCLSPSGYPSPMVHSLHHWLVYTEELRRACSLWGWVKWGSYQEPSGRTTESPPRLQVGQTPSEPRQRTLTSTTSAWRWVSLPRAWRWPKGVAMDRGPLKMSLGVSKQRTTRSPNACAMEEVSKEVVWIKSKGCILKCQIMITANPGNIQAWTTQLQDKRVGKCNLRSCKSSQLENIFRGKPIIIWEKIWFKKKKVGCSGTCL